jgi:hypothetical protein
MLPVRKLCGKSDGLHQQCWMCCIAPRR